MILPIRTSIRPSRTPYANYALIAANAFIFLLQYHVDPNTHHLAFRPWVTYFMLTPAYPHLWQFVSYAFLHSGIMHIFFNMFFLYLFGNNVNDKLGHIGYLCLYLAGAVFSAIGQTALHYSAVPTLGASGAVAAVTGAYLVLFPQTLITVIYWFIFIGTLEVPALYFIAFKLILIDNILARTASSIAYDAHLAGYALGITAMLIMLATGLLTSTGFDLWSMIKQWNRRRRYRDVVSAGYDPFTGRTPTKQMKAKEVTKPIDKQKMKKIEQLRNDIASRMLQRNLSAAAEKYLELIALDSAQILPRQYLLDIANQLASESRHADAAKAYEQFLTHYGNYEYIEQVQLMLGLLYSRYLDQPSQAKKHLSAAVEKLSDPGQLKMCRDELEKLQNI
jgi:membrane associated rhomboid family serine protease